MLSFFSGIVLPCHAETGEASQEPLRIGKININRSNVFDLSNPVFDRIPYTWANKFHIVTQEVFIRQDLLFKEGDVYSENLMRESERLLRTRPIFRSVLITHSEPVNGVVDIDVQTVDVWTTSLQLAYGRAGGENFYEFGFLEHNFLGLGHAFGAFVRHDIDRTIKGMTYDDPHLFGTSWDGFFGYGQDEKGKDWQTQLTNPYKSFLTTHSEGGSYRMTDDEDRLFENGEESAHFDHRMVAARAFVSMAIDPNEAVANRTGVAYETRQDEFSGFVSAVPMEMPENRTVNALLATYEFKQNRFEKMNGIRTFDRDEDYNYGWGSTLAIGPALRSMGSTNDGLVAHAKLGNNWRFPGDQYVFANLLFDGRQEKEKLVDSVVHLNGQYAAKNWWSNNFLTFRGEFVYGINLPPDKQFLLGGENGLRGYSVRQFSGDRKALITLENRQLVLYDWLELFNLGWAVFADTGRAWEKEDNLTIGDFKSDVGLGLRFSPSRSYDPSLIRLDLAYAVNDNNRKSRWVLNIGGDLRFGEVEERKFDQ